MFELNDKVTIINPGQVYSSYSDWFKQNNISEDIAKKHAYDKQPKTSDIGTIVAVGTHDFDKDLVIFGVEINKKVYIMHENGLEYAPDPNEEKPKTISFEELIKLGG